MGLSKWRSSQRELRFELCVPVADAEALCRGAFRALGWIEDEAGPSIRASEDLAKLCCHTWPVEVEVFVTGDQAVSKFEVVATTPGGGPIQQRQLRDRLNRLAREIRIRGESEAGR